MHYRDISNGGMPLRGTGGYILITRNVSNGHEIRSTKCCRNLGRQLMISAFYRVRSWRCHYLRPEAVDVNRSESINHDTYVVVKNLCRCHSKRDRKCSQMHMCATVNDKPRDELVVTSFSHRSRTVYVERINV